MSKAPTAAAMISTLKTDSPDTRRGMSKTLRTNNDVDKDQKSFADTLKRTVAGTPEKTTVAKIPRLEKSAVLNVNKKSISPNVLLRGENQDSSIVLADLPIEKGEVRAAEEPVELSLAQLPIDTSPSTPITNASLTLGADTKSPVSAKVRNKRSPLTDEKAPQSPTKAKTGQSTVISPGKISRSRRVEVVDQRSLSVSGDREPRRSVDSLRGAVKSEGADRPVSFSDSAVSVKPGLAVVETEIGIDGPQVNRQSDESAASALARKLDAQAGNEIVRQVKVVLNRAEAGEIRINLRPENLGRVRVRIQLEDNRLAGRIFVETAAAREAFRSAIDGLQTRLVESGFGAADLELAWDERSFSDPREQNAENRGFDSREGNTGEAIREFEDFSLTTIDSVEGRINMVV